MTLPRSRFTIAVVAIFLAVAVLASCSSTPANLQESTAERLQSGVLEVATAAAAGDYVSAQAALAVVEADLLTATADGQVTAARSAEIQSAINLVKTDLADAIAASTPTPEPKPGKGNGNCKKKDTCDENDE